MVESFLRDCRRRIPGFDSRSILTAAHLSSAATLTIPSSAKNAFFRDAVEPLALGARSRQPRRRRRAFPSDDGGRAMPGSSRPEHPVVDGSEIGVQSHRVDPGFFRNARSLSSWKGARSWTSDNTPRKRRPS